MPTELIESSSSSHSDAKRSGDDLSILQQEKRHRTGEVSSPSQGGNPLSSMDESVGLETTLPENPRNVVDLVGQKHGPKFLQLEKSTQMWLLKLHRNLGHPSASKLTEACRQLNCSSEIINALSDLRCSTCVENQRPSIPRVSALKSEGDFGDSISVDGHKLGAIIMAINFTFTISWTITQCTTLQLFPCPERLPMPFVLLM